MRLQPPSPQCDVPWQRSSEQSPSQQCSVPMVVTAEETTAEVERAEQRTESFLNELEEGIASFTDEEFAKLYCIIKSRDRAAAPAITALIGAAHV